MTAFPAAERIARDLHLEGGLALALDSWAAVYRDRIKATPSAEETAVARAILEARLADTPLPPPPHASGSSWQTPRLLVGLPRGE